MFAQVFPLFQDNSIFTTVPSLYAGGGIAAATATAMPAAVDPTAQGVISILSIGINVFVFSLIMMRAKKKSLNPYTNEIFSDTKDFKEAMARKEVEAPAKTSLNTSKVVKTIQVNKTSTKPAKKVVKKTTAKKVTTTKTTAKKASSTKAKASTTKKPNVRKSTGAKKTSTKK